MSAFTTNTKFVRTCSILGGAFILNVLLLTLTTESATAANLVFNGSFEEPILPDQSWTIFPWFPGAPLPHESSSIPGWSLSGDFFFEVQRGVAGSPSDGFQHVELPGEPYSVGIFQDLTTTPGLEYVLKFAFSARPGTSLSANGLQVQWGSTVVDNLFADGIGLLDTDWNYFTYNLTAISTTTRLEFVSLGDDASLGTYLDDVSVEIVPSVASVPEPSSVFGLLAVGAIGAGAILKRQQQHKV